MSFRRLLRQKMDVCLVSCPRSYHARKFGSLNLCQIGAESSAGLILCLGRLRTNSKFTEMLSLKHRFDPFQTDPFLDLAKAQVN